MDIDEFIEALSKTDGPWRINEFLCIVRGETCPICAVANYGEFEFWDAEDLIDLGADDSVRIVRASDNHLGHDAVLRARLLTATVNR